MKFATPLAAATDVVPEAKLPEDERHVDGVVGAGVAGGDRVAELVFDRHADGEVVAPAADGEAGCVVMASLLSAAGVMVKPFVVPLTTTELTVADAVMVGEPDLRVGVIEGRRRRGAVGDGHGRQRSCLPMSA